MSLRRSSDLNSHLRSVLDISNTTLTEPETKRPRQLANEERDYQFDIEDDTPNSNRQDETGNETSLIGTDLIGGGASGEDTNDEGIDNGHGEDELALPHAVFVRGSDVFRNNLYIAHVKAVAHRRRTRYSLSDHLFNVTIKEKPGSPIPYLIDLQNLIKKALIKILDRLKLAYNSSVNQNQIYLTVVEKHILRGLNTGNYSLNAPSHIIANWVLALLYNYLKSKQTLKLNESFKIQIKILSRRHTSNLMENKRRTFQKKIYH